MQSPNDAPFQTMEQVNDYLSGNTVECLICGKRYQWLHNHIVKMHDTSPDDYRRRFGIPFTRSLTSAKFRAECSARVGPQKHRVPKACAGLQDRARPP